MNSCLAGLEILHKLEVYATLRDFKYLKWYYIVNYSNSKGIILNSR